MQGDCYRVLAVLPTYFASNGREDEDTFAGLESIQLGDQGDAIKIDDNIECT